MAAGLGLSEPSRVDSGSVGVSASPSPSGSASPSFQSNGYMPASDQGTPVDLAPAVVGFAVAFALTGFLLIASGVWIIAGFRYAAAPRRLSRKLPITQNPFRLATPPSTYGHLSHEQGSRVLPMALALSVAPSPPVPVTRDGIGEGDAVKGIPSW